MNCVVDFSLLLWNMFCIYGKYKYLYFEVRGALMGHCPAWCLVHLPLKEPPTCLLTGPNTKLTSTHAEPSLYTKTMQNCFLFLAILCNKSTNHYYLFLWLYISRCPVRFYWHCHLMRAQFTVFCQNYIQKLI